MKNCCVKECKSIFVKGGSITFHTFPCDPVRKAQWVKNIGREDFVPRYHSRICSKHFEEECFDREKFGATWLKSTAVPTIFNFNTTTVRNGSTNGEESLQIQETSSSEIRIKEAYTISYDDSTSVDEASDYKNERSANKRKKEKKEIEPFKKGYRLNYLGDFKKGVSYTKEELHLGLEIANKLVKNQNKKLKSLRRTNERLRKKVQRLDEVLEEYKKKVYIPSDVLKEALARNKKLAKPKPAINDSASKTVENCDNSVPESA